MVRITPGSFPQGLPQSLGARGRFGHAGISPSPTGFSNQPSFSPSPQPGMESLETVDEDPERGDPPETFPSSGGPDRSTQPQMLSRPPGIDLFPRSPPVSETTRAHTHPSGFGTPSNRRDFLGEETPSEGSKGTGILHRSPRTRGANHWDPPPVIPDISAPPVRRVSRRIFEEGHRVRYHPRIFVEGRPTHNHPEERTLSLRVPPLSSHMPSKWRHRHPPTNPTSCGVKRNAWQETPDYSRLSLSSRM